MAHWSIRLLERVQIERDGEDFKPRTGLQTLLIARICAHFPKSISRFDTAEMLWPHATRSQAFAYLRKAVMELRRAGFPIIGHEDQLSIEGTSITCDLIELKNSDEWIDDLLDINEVLKGLTGAVPDEVRRIVENLGHTRLIHGPEATNEEKQNLVLAELGSFVIGAHPDVAIEFLIQRPDLFAKASTQESLLDLVRNLTADTSIDSNASLKLKVMAAKVARQRTIYSLAERWLSEAQLLFEKRRAFGDLAKLYEEYSFLKLEQREWKAGKEYGERAVVAAQKFGDDEMLSLAHSALGRTLWQVMDYDESAKNFLNAYRFTSSHQHRVLILANLSFLWGVLHVSCELPDADPLAPDDGFYVVGANSYRQFATHFGRGEYALAARAAAATIEITANNQLERLFCVALDCAAIAFAGLRQDVESAACVRVGTRFRNQINHPRAPMEKDSVRRHVHGPFWSPQINQMVSNLYSDDPTTTATRVSRRLRKKSSQSR